MTPFSTPPAPQDAQPQRAKPTRTGAPVVQQQKGASKSIPCGRGGAFVERPLLMCGEMVRATLDGRKTQTRRIIKPQPTSPKMTMDEGIWSDTKDPVTRYFACPHGKPGDRLWVKETHYFFDGPGSFAPFKTGRVWYRADGLKTFKWRPSIFMPRWASRITLEIVSVRVERLQDITEEDAKAEGVPEEKYAVHYYCDEGDPNDPEDFGTHRCNWRFGFKMLWDSLNAKRDGGKYSWDSNPWVWRIEFRRIKP